MFRRVLSKRRPEVGKDCVNPYKKVHKVDRHNECVYVYKPAYMWQQSIILEWASLCYSTGIQWSLSKC